MLKARLRQMLGITDNNNKDIQWRWAAELRRELSYRNRQIALINKSLHELTGSETPSVIFGRSQSSGHGNFYPASWRNISAHPEWARRLAKVHTGSRRASTPRGLAMERA